MTGCSSPRSVHDDSGRIVGALIVGLDVTETRDYRSRLDARDEQLRLLVDTALDAVITCDVTSRIVDWNTGAEKLFGWSRSEALGRSLGDTVIPPDLRAAHDAGMKRFLATGEGPVLGRRIEIEAVDRTGRRFPIELAINPIPTPGGMMFSAFLRDISSRIAAEKRLAGSEYRLRSSLDAMRAGTWDLQLDADGGVVGFDIDDRARELLGEDAEVLPAARAFVHPEDRVLVSRAWLAHVSGSNSRYEIEYRILDAEGRLGWRRELGMRVDDEKADEGPEFAGRMRPVRRVIGVVTDETRAHEIADSLAAAQKLEAVGQIASGFAHDLNNMLSAILGNATLAATPPDLPERTRKGLETIKESISRGRALTQNLLMLGKPGRVRRSQIDPIAIVKSTLELARPILGPAFEHSLDVDLASETPEVECDANQLQQALLNVLINARDATDGEGALRIRAGRSTEYSERGRPMVLIEIADDGPGMPPDVLAQARMPFFTTKGERGTGLGLAMVDVFANEAGGRLDIESTSGKGTTIRLFLPAVRGAALIESRPDERGADEDETVSPERPLQVMIVEDHPLLRPMLAEALANSGCQVKEASDGQGALEALNDFQPDLLVLDVNLPGMRGDLIATAVRERLDRAIPVVFITGNADFQPPAWRDVHLLRKPFELHELIERVFDLAERTGDRGS
jgi:PAS domain S-box-containing protein